MLHPRSGVRAVGFDLDGTLIDTVPDLAAAVNGMLVELGAPAQPYEQIRGMIGDGVDTLVARALRASLEDDARAAALQSDGLAKFRRAYGARLYEDSRLYPHVRETLQSLAAAGLALCCITNKHSAFTIPLLHAAGLDGLLAFTLCADRIEDRKPQPTLLLAACKRLAVEPRELLYVGDSPRDVRAARAAGCRSGFVTYGYAGSAAAAEPADLSVSRFEELIGLGRRPPVP